MTARTTACTRWWGDGAVRGLVLGLLYPLAPAVVGGIVDSFEWGAAVALFGVLVGAFLGPAAGLAVGVVCSRRRCSSPGCSSLLPRSTSGPGRC